MTDRLAPAPRPVDPLTGEIIGAPIRIERAPGVATLPLDGTIADESLGTLLVRLPGRTRLRRIPKAGLEATILLGGRSIPLKGETLRQRPEDRTKRLAIPGRRRDR